MLRNLRDHEQVFHAIENSWYEVIRRFARNPRGEVHEDAYIKRVYTGVP